MQLKKLIRYIMAGITIFIALAIGINFWFVPTTQEVLKSSGEQVIDMRINILEMELPVRVIENISLQVKADENNSKKQSLIDAYERNINSLAEKSSLIYDDILVLNSDLKKICSLSLNRFSVRVDAINKITNYIIIDLDILKNELTSAAITSTNVDLLKSTTIELNKHIEELKNAENELRNNIVNDFSVVVNSFFIIMVILLVILTAGIYKFIIVDQAFILKSFEYMERNQFDFDLLPNKHLIFEEEIRIHNRIREIFNEEKFTHNIKQIVSNAYHIDELVERLYNELSLNMGIDRVGIAFVDYGEQKFITEYGKTKSDILKLGPGFEVPFGETSLTKLLTTKKSVITVNLNDSLKQNPNSPSLKLITEEGMKSNLIIPLIMGEAVFGVIFFSSMNENFFTEFHKIHFENIIDEISGYLNRSYFTKVILSRVTNSFAILVDKKDNETGEHINRMVSYSVTIADELLKKNIKGYDIDKKFVLEIERNASSHDIGKVAIPDDILKKPGKLTPEEWEIMKTHAEVGADIFKSLRESLKVFESDFYKFAEEIARYHHEKWDGSGYPEGLSGIQIPLAARIVAIGDVFDALTTKRHYKQAFTFDESVDIIKKSSGSHFDPVLVDVFVESLDKISKIYKSD